MRELLLNDGNSIPLIGFGTYKASDEEGIEVVKNALKSGYRLIDTASKYGNEESVGKGILASGVPRDEIFVTTKLWRENLGYESAEKELNDSLLRLKLDYIDLYLIHWPANSQNYGDWRKTNSDTWRKLEELKIAGKIKSIGVSNFWPEHLEALLKTAEIIPAINQIEYHPGYWQPELVQYCREREITINSWSPFARGAVFENEILKNIAEKNGKSVAQVCLRWNLQRDVVAIPKASTIERIKANMDIFDFELSMEEMWQIDHIPLMGFSGELPSIWPDRIKQLP